MRWSFLPAILLAGSLFGEGADDYVVWSHVIDASTPAPWGHDVIYGQFDSDWWALQNHAPDLSIYVDTGIGALCGCPKGSPFAPYVEIWSRSAGLVGAYQATLPGALSIQLLGAPAGTLFVRVSGVPTGAYRHSEYNFMVF